MKRLIEQRHIVKQNIWSLMAFCLICYFSYHAVMGERSVLRLMSLERKLTTVTKTYEENHSARVALEDKVARLRPGSIDPDLLEEQARHILGYTRAGEYVILN